MPVDTTCACEYGKLFSFASYGPQLIFTPVKLFRKPHVFVPILRLIVPIAFYYYLCYFVLMGMSNVREIQLMGQKVAADRTNLPGQLSILIQEHDGNSLPLLPGDFHAYAVKDRLVPQATHLVLVVHEGGMDATIRRHVKDSLSSSPTHEELLEDNSLPTRMLSQSDPIYLISEEGFFERIIYRRG